MIHQKRSTCRICDGTTLSLVLPLGRTPLANSLLRSPEEFAGEPAFPLDVYFCSSCSLVQLLDVVDPEVLFRHYLYVTGTSDTIAAHNVAYARTVVDLLGLGRGDLVAEVGSNDGSLLKRFRDHGVRTVGIEPATNIAEQARAEGIDTVNRFFNSTCGREVRASHGAAKAVIGNNVLAHVDDTRDFLRGAKALLDDGGLVITEVPYLRELVDRLEYDTVYHEHLCYFSVTALMRLCEAVGLSIVRIDRVPVHGGSLRMYAGHVERQREHAPAVRAMAAEEARLGLTSLSRYERLAQDVAENRRRLLELLEGLRRDGRTVAAYGAPAKGNTLLNYCGLDTTWIAFTVDKNPLKVGLFTPGAHLPILPVSALLERRPDYALILAWNFAEEVLRQQRAYRDAGGRFILPIPEPRVL